MCRIKVIIHPHIIYLYIFLQVLRRYWYLTNYNLKRCSLILIFHAQLKSQIEKLMLQFTTSGLQCI